MRQRAAGRKLHPKVEVGDVFGPYTVTALLGRGFKGRSDERVEWRCSCGLCGSAWVFNLRRVAKRDCSHKTTDDASVGKAGGSAAAKKEQEELRVFANALRGFLGLEPLALHDGRYVRPTVERDEMVRFDVIPYPDFSGLPFHG